MNDLSVKKYSDSNGCGDNKSPVDAKRTFDL